MAAMTIRNLEPALEARLRVKAAEHGRSMEEEARQILRAALAPKRGAPASLFEEIRRLVDPIGGVDLGIPPREPMPEPPAFA
ncbi:MAG TPA: hypothetical protein VMU93_04225 [Caulobacteraceae bacterium]|nr:hypothetical protein [Caulobacteraceae bacterium]